MEKFVITRKTYEKYQVILKSKAGSILLMSAEYAAKISCRKATETLRNCAQDSSKFQKKTSTD